jgi:hypothetical protein
MGRTYIDFEGMRMLIDVGFGLVDLCKKAMLTQGKAFHSLDCLVLKR